MYTSFYQLDSKPFDHCFEQKLYWEGEVQRDALSTMQRGLLHNRKFLYLKGAEGTGKTTLVHALTRSLGNDFAWALVDEPSLDRIEFYNDIGAAFGLDQKFTSKVQFLIRFSHFLYRTNEEEKNILLLIDECHQLSQELVDELWLLSNIEKGGTRLLNIYFIGQHLFDELLLKPKNNAVRQRITRNVELVPLDVESTADYVRHRVKAAGGYDTLFAPEAIQAVHRYCRGNMQQINMLCDNALSTGSVQEKRTIDQEIIDECAFKLGLGGEATANVAVSQDIVQAEVKAVDEPAAAAREVAVPVPGPEVQEERGGGGWLKYAAGVVALGLAGLALYLWWPGMQTMNSTPATEGDGTLAVSADGDVSQLPAANASGAEQEVAEEQVSQSSLAAVAASGVGGDTAGPPPPDVRTSADEAMTDLPQKQPEAAGTAAAQVEDAALDAAAVPDTAGQTVLAREGEPQGAGPTQQQLNPRGTTGGAEQIAGSEAVASTDAGEKSADDNTLGQTTATLEPAQPVDAAALVIAEAEREAAAAAADAKRKAPAGNSEVTAAPVATLTGTSEEPAEEQAEGTEPQPAAAAATMEPNKVILALRPSSLQLTREGKREFDRFVDALRDYPQAKLLVKGFVSAKTNSDENIQLSEDRAKSVQKLLTAQGIEEERIEVKGMGNLEPIASNDTREGRRKNRRVEIVVVDDGT